MNILQKEPETLDRYLPPDDLKKEGATPSEES
jgi:hypothetical protein